jgi:DNA (cytosine-5)-methyltransferase 1
MFDFFEFFAGGGMVRAGLGSAKWRCRFANDFDHKKSAVYRLNWGDGILKTADVRALKGARRTLIAMRNGSRSR